MTEIRKWKQGDRVVRHVFLDDGTWRREGDTCLKESPLKHGMVYGRGPLRDDEVFVVWDDGTQGAYLNHGLREESNG